MQSVEDNMEGMLPKSEYYKFPAIPYILGIQKPKTANSDNDPFGLFIGVNDGSSDNFNGLIITPPSPEEVNKNKEGAEEEVSNYSGSNIKFNSDGNLVLDNKLFCSIKETVIGVSKVNNYIYLLHLEKDTNNYKKLWILPGDIFSLLCLDRIPINYSFAIEDGKFNICKIRLPCYIHDEPEISSSKVLELSNGIKAFISDKEEREKLDKSYLQNGDDKFYVKDFNMSLENNKILVKAGELNLGMCESF